MEKIMLSFVIKAFNEQENIARAIESCLLILKNIKGEIIVADSLSTDKTVEIASGYPVKVVKLKNKSDQRCGAALQLGYQYCSGNFVFVMDGDMEVEPEFVWESLLALQRDETLAGVGGIIQDVNLDNLEFVSRAARAPSHLHAGYVDRLDGGGIYRKSAIVSVDYISDLNLHGFEELELAARLAQKGWRFKRLNCNSVKHYGYKIGAYSLLFRRIRGRYVLATGELLRSISNTEKMIFIASKNRTLWTSLFVWIWLLSIIFGLILLENSKNTIILFLVFSLFPFLAMSIKRKSFRLGLYAVTVWVVYAVGALFGLAQLRKNPKAWISSEIVSNRSKE